MARTCPTSLADSESQRAYRAMSARVAVAADDGLTGLRNPRFRADDVDDAPLRALQTKQLHAEGGAVFLELTDLFGGRVDRDRHATEHLLGARRSRVIHGRQGEIGAADRQAALAQDRKSLRRGDLMDQVQVDIQDSRCIGRLSGDLVLVPDLFEHRLRGL